MQQPHLDPNEVDMVIYHASCADGAAGALCAMLRGGGPVLLHPGKHANVADDPEALERARGKNLLLVDFVYDREFLLRLRDVTKKLYVLDHHRSAMEKLQDLDFCVFDMNRSGARMAWDYFFPGKRPPRLIQFIEDRDLWRWAVPGSREFTTAFYNTVESEPLAFIPFLERDSDGNWKDKDVLIEKFLSDGKVILDYVTSTVERTSKNGKLLPLKSANGKSIAIVNEMHFVSELGHVLSQEYDFALLVNLDLQPTREAATLNCSLRSKGHLETSNCAKFASQFGGGGHPGASGFRWPGSIAELATKIKTLTL